MTWRRAVATFVVGLLIGAGGLWVIDRANGAEQVFPHRVCAGNDTWMTCADWLASEFRAGRRGRTVDAARIFTPRVQDMIVAEHFKNTGRVTRAMRDSWWDGFVSDVSCGLASSASWGAFTCARASDLGVGPVPMTGVVKDTAKVELLCGGAMVLGSLRGGGYWGAGIGAGGCLWGVALERW